MRRLAFLVRSLAPSLAALGSTLAALGLALPALGLTLGCSGDEREPAEQVTMRTPASTGLGADAGTGLAPTAPAPAPAAAAPAPRTGWLDPAPTTTRWGGSGAASHKARARESAPLAIQLRSTPPGATVMVDGRRVGVTPAFWEGHADGKAHDFVFILPQHAVAHYRFVPVQSGHVHPVLEKILEPEAVDEHSARAVPALN